MNLYCFDIDGTLIRSFMREGDKEHDYDDVEILDGRRAKLASLEDDDSRFALVTNQGGVAFGYQTEEQVFAKVGRVLTLLQFFGGYPTSVHISVNHPKAKIEKYRKDDGYRKPAPGMLIEAMTLHGSPPSTTTFVGDMDSDRECAQRAGVRYIDASDFFAPPVSQ